MALATLMPLGFLVAYQVLDRLTATASFYHIELCMETVCTSSQALATQLCRHAVYTTDVGICPLLVARLCEHVHGFDCTKQFWPSLTPGDNFTVQGTCSYAQDYPRLFGETKVSVAYTNRWQRYARSKKLFNTVLPILQDSLNKSIEEYSKYAEIPKEIVVILTEKIKPEYLATWYPVAK